jgi:hypothetical protein
MGTQGPVQGQVMPRPGINPGQPTVDLADVDHFLTVYRQGSLVILFDGSTRQAMVDYANTALKTYFMMLQQQAAQIRKIMEEKLKQQAAQKAENPQGGPPVPPSAPQRGLITLTD